MLQKRRMTMWALRLHGAIDTSLTVMLQTVGIAEEEKMAVLFH